MKLKAKLEQNLSLSQQQQQSLRILQMGSKQLHDYLGDFVMHNPAADMKLLDSDPGLIDISTAPSRYGNGINSLNHSDGQCLKELLSDQLPHGLSVRQERAAELIISGLDERGYLKEDISKLAAGQNLSTEEMQEALRLIQNMEPAGVGAADIKECLLLQLERKRGSYELEKLLINEYLEDIAGGRLRKAAASAKKPLSKVQAAVKNIKKLNPIPANGLNCSEKPVYVCPEVYIHETEGRLSLESGCINICDIDIADDFNQMMDEIDDAESREYMSGQLREIRELKNALSQRKRTIIRITEEILRIQKDFFLGKTGYLQALSLEDMAELLGLVPSTISRAIQDKYLVCDKGAFPYKYFFSRKLPANDNKQEGSSSLLMAEIKELIAAENPEKPLSDQQIAELLECRGIKIARRTVAKYREKIGIPGTYLRHTQ